MPDSMTITNQFTKKLLLTAFIKISLRRLHRHLQVFSIMMTISLVVAALLFIFAASTNVQSNHDIIESAAMNPGVEENISKFNGVILPKDFSGLDGPALHELKHSMRVNLQNSNCILSGTENTLPLFGLDTDYISNITSWQLPYGKAIVSQPRKRMTALLAKAALTVAEGDFVETGCYIGTSASIMMNILMNFDSCDRKLWVFDSFEGLPPPTKEDHQQGRSGMFDATEDTFVKNLQAVKSYDADRVVITKGWFRDTCRSSAVQNIAFLRLDGDLFMSTMDAISALYDRVVPGGYIYVDDYGSFDGCRKAIDMFRVHNKIFEPLHFVHEGPSNARSITYEAVWWIKRN